MCKRSVICLLVGVCVKVLVHFHSVLLDGFQDLWINILIKYITINYGRCWWAFFQANVYSFPPAGTQPNCITAAKHCQKYEWMTAERKKKNYTTPAISFSHSPEFTRAVFYSADPIFLSLWADKKYCKHTVTDLMRPVWCCLHLCKKRNAFNALNMLNGTYSVFFLSFYSKCFSNA